MDSDFFASLGFGAYFSVVAVIVGWLISVFILYAIIRDGVAHGMRKHQLWMEKRYPPRTTSGYEPITPPQP